MAEVKETILQEAQRLIYGDRNVDYGHPLDNFTHTAALLNAMYGTTFTPEDCPKIMILFKLSRSMNKEKRDNWVDIAGYAGTAQECVDEAMERAVKE